MRVLNFYINVRSFGSVISRDVDLTRADLNKGCDEREMRGVAY